MALVLVRVKRIETSENDTFYLSDRVRRHPYYVNGSRVDVERNVPVVKQADFFEVDDRDLEICLEDISKANPGCEVMAYTLTHSAVTPPGEYTLKKVSADGVLPA